MMGKEFVVTSLEEMCDLMCGNVIPESSTEEEREYIDDFERMECEEGDDEDDV